MPSVPPESLNHAETAPPVPAGAQSGGSPFLGSGPVSTTGGVRHSIASRLLFWFLVIAIIPCSLLTAITARIASSTLEQSVRDNLIRIAASKAN